MTKYISIKSLLGTLFAALFSALAGLVINQYEKSKENACNYFDVWQNVTHQDILQKELDKVKFQILWNGNSLNGFSQIHVEVFNYSGKDFDKVPVYIEIIPDNDDSLQLIASTIVGENSLPEEVKSTNEKINPSVSGALKYGYVIKVANRADSVVHWVFNADYAVVSSKTPKVNVTISKDGIRKREYDSTHFDPPKWYESNIAVIVYTIFGLIVYIIIIIRVSNNSQRKRDAEFWKYLLKELKDKVNNNGLTLDAELLFNEYQSIVNKFNQEHTTRLTRLVAKIKKALR